LSIRVPLHDESPHGYVVTKNSFRLLVDSTYKGGLVLPQLNPEMGVRRLITGVKGVFTTQSGIIGTA